MNISRSYAVVYMIIFTSYLIGSVCFLSKPVHSMNSNSISDANQQRSNSSIELNKLVKSIINTFDEDSDQQLDLQELKNMLENPKIIDAYVKILNKKHPSFFHDPFIIETKKNKSEITDEQKLRENDNLKSKKRKALQEEFKKNEFKNIHNPISRGSIITTTTINILSFNQRYSIYSNRNSRQKNEYLNLKKNNESSMSTKSYILNDHIAEPSKSSQTLKLLTPIKINSLGIITKTIKLSNRTTDTTSTPNRYTTIKKLLNGKLFVTTESSKQILERFFKSKNKTYEKSSM